MELLNGALYMLPHNCTINGTYVWIIDNIFYIDGHAKVLDTVWMTFQIDWFNDWPWFSGSRKVNEFMSKKKKKKIFLWFPYIWSSTSLLFIVVRVISELKGSYRENSSGVVNLNSMCVLGELSGLTQVGNICWPLKTAQDSTGFQTNTVWLSETDRWQLLSVLLLSSMKKEWTTREKVQLHWLCSFA